MLQERSSGPAASRFSNPSFGTPSSSSFEGGLDSPVRALIFLMLFYIVWSNQNLLVLTSKHVQVREDPPPYKSPVMQRFESFENPLAGRGAQSFGSQDDDEPAPSENLQSGKALYDFTAGGDDEVSVTIVFLVDFLGSISFSSTRLLLLVSAAWK